MWRKENLGYASATDAPRTGTSQCEQGGKTPAPLSKALTAWAGAVTTRVRVRTCDLARGLVHAPPRPLVMLQLSRNVPGLDAADHAVEPQPAPKGPVQPKDRPITIGDGMRQCAVRQRQCAALPPLWLLSLAGGAGGGEE
jgi:hypothetical protein